MCHLNTPCAGALRHSLPCIPCSVFSSCVSLPRHSFSQPHITLECSISTCLNPILNVNEIFGKTHVGNILKGANAHKGVRIAVLFQVPRSTSTWTVLKSPRSRFYKSTLVPKTGAHFRNELLADSRALGSYLRHVCSLLSPTTSPSSAHTTPSALLNMYVYRYKYVYTWSEIKQIFWGIPNKNG